MGDSPGPRWARSTSGSKRELVSLSALSAGERAKVVELNGGRGMLSRMTALGFTPGAEVKILQNYGRGPLITRVRDARVALGRGEARRVLVRRER